jgi:hypothetical protein
MGIVLLSSKVAYDNLCHLVTHGGARSFRLLQKAAHCSVIPFSPALTYALATVKILTGSEQK